jgi:DNA damage-inducible protein 1
VCVCQGRDVDLLLGLDMLKAHQACIDLEKNVLRIQTREVRFLSEHELPEKARIMDSGVDDPTSPISAAGPSEGPARNQPPRTSSFPGGGHTLGATPATGQGAAPARGRPSPAPQATSRHSEEAIATIMGLGATREVAISTLDAAGGDLNVAASLLF